MTFQRFTWTSQPQPQHPVGVDTSYGIDNVCLPSASGLQAIIGPGFYANPTSERTVGVTGFGRSVKSSGGSAYFNRLSRFVTGVSGGFVFTPSALPNPVGLWSLANTNGPVSGSPYFIIQQAGADLKVYFCTDFVITLTGICVVGKQLNVSFGFTLATSGSVDICLCVNGAVYTATGTASSNSTASEYLLTGYIGTAQGDLGLYWSSQLRLPNALLRSLSGNPWQLFQPTSRAIWVPVSASTGSEVSGSLTTDSSTVTSSASVSPAASASIATADSTFTGTAYTSPVATASITTAESTVTASASTSVGVSGSLTTDASTVSASASVSPLATASVTTADSTFAGDASSGSSVASMSITTEDAFAAAVARVSPSALMAVYTDDATVSGSAQGEVTGVYPSPSTVLAGVAYGPSGTDYVGTLSYPTAAEIAAAVRAELTAEMARIDVAVSTRTTLADIFAAV